MKNLLLTSLFLLVSTVTFSQAYEGKGDSKFQLGLNVQSKGTGITGTYDYGLGDNFSIGATSTYLLGLNDLLNVPFADKFDLKVRFNANLGNVFQVGENIDIYPGLALSLKNFGGHLGARYFFTDGFGVFMEMSTPFATYKTDLTPSEKLHNQFAVNIGASFNL